MKLFINTGSVTYAAKAARVLAGFDIKCRVVKRQNDSGGCGYGVELKDQEQKKVTEILQNAGVRIVNVREQNDLP